MARGAPKNPINDIINTVGGWLGGRGPGTNPQVQAAMDATRAIGKVVDTATGGFGQALLSDAQRMAMTGSSTPSALYKTAAVNLGAAAAGVGAAKVAGKVAGKVAQSDTFSRATSSVSNALRKEVKTMPVSRLQKKYQVSEPYSGYTWDTLGESEDFWEGPIMRRLDSIDGGDMERLTEDIQNRGILTPVRVSGNQVLDGHHRIYAAASIDPKFPVPVQRLDKGVKKIRGGGKNRK